MRDSIKFALLLVPLCVLGAIGTLAWSLNRELDTARAALEAATGKGTAWTETCVAERVVTRETRGASSHETMLDCAGGATVIVPRAFTVGQYVTVYAVGQ